MPWFCTKPSGKLNQWSAIFWDYLGMFREYSQKSIFLTASLPTQSKELLHHYFQQQSLWHLLNLKHITSCITRIDTIVSNCVILIKDKSKHVHKVKQNNKCKKRNRKKRKRKRIVKTCINLFSICLVHFTMMWNKYIL